MDKQDLLKQINATCENTMIDHLGIEVTDVGEDFVCGRMPVNEHTRQPDGLLHGGASVSFAETIGSIGAGLRVNREQVSVVGVEINANHVQSAREGWVYGKAQAVYIGSRTQVWEIKITGENQELICIARLTLVIKKK
jgi:1,4-dihydroxy-2-naphthoyl-CoA hydrolase